MCICKFHADIKTERMVFVAKNGPRSDLRVKQILMVGMYRRPPSRCMLRTH